MALSTVSRQKAVGYLDFNDKSTRSEVLTWLSYIYSYYEVALFQLSDSKITDIFCTEVFMEEYGAYYYAARELNLNIIRFNGTVRDDCIIIQRMTDESDRRHFASFSQKTWSSLRDVTNISQVRMLSLETSTSDTVTNGHYLQESDYTGLNL